MKSPALLFVILFFSHSFTFSQCDVNFSFNSCISIGDTVIFSNASDSFILANATSIQWRVNGALVGTSQSLSYVFSSNGNNLVELQMLITNPLCPLFLYTFSETVTILNSTHSPAIGASSPGGTLSCTPLNVCFGINTFIANDPTTTYTIDFGDGTPATIFSHPPPDSVCHTYTQTSCGSGLPGNAFDFTITAVNGCGITSAAISPIQIYSPPTAAFQPSRHLACANQLIQFVNNSLVGFGNFCDSLTFYEWDFGDGTPPVLDLSGSIQAHSYASTGTYLITLRAWNVCDTSITSDIIVIEDVNLPVAGMFVTDTLTGFPPHAITFFVILSDTLNPTATAFWDFGDGVTETWTHQDFLNNTDSNGLVTHQHAYSNSSCGSNFMVGANTFNNSFLASLTIINVCGISSGAAIFPIQIFNNRPDSLWVSPITPNSARLNWTALPDAHHFVIRGRRVGTTGFVTLQIPAGSPNYKDVFGLSDGFSYEWQIKSFCDAAETIYSEWSDFNVFTTGCQPTDSIWADPVSATGARLNWLPVDGAAGYEIKGRRLGATAFTTILVPNAPNYKDVFGLQSGFSYEWTISTWCNQSGTAASAFLPFDTFTTSLGARTTQGVTEEHTTEYKELKCVVSPNPVSDLLTVSFFQIPENMDGKMEVFDLAGEKIVAQNINAEEPVFLDVQNFNTGVYMILIETGMNRTHVRFVISR